MSITLVDNASDKLNEIARSHDRFVSSLGKSTSSMGSTATASDTLVDSMQKQIHHAQELSRYFSNLAASMAKYAISINAFRTMASVLHNTVASGWEYNSMLESNRIGIAGILSSVTTLNGKQLQWNQALSASSTIMRTLREQALAASLNTADLVDTFRGLLGPGVGAGLKIDQIAQFATVGSKAVMDMGLPSNQYLQELRSILSGNIRPASSTLATALGITNQDIKKAQKSSEGLFKFLMDRLEGFKNANADTAKTWQGTMARLKSGLSMTFGEGMEPVFNYAKEQVGEIADHLVKIDESGKKLQINTEFRKQIEDASKATINLVESLKPLGKLTFSAGSAIFGHFANSPILSGGLIGSAVLANVSSDLRKVSDDTNHTYQATTLLGKAYQRLQDNVTGYSKGVRAANELARDMANVMYGKITVSKRGEDSPVYGLAEEYKAAGIEAQKANEMQDKVFDTLMTKGTKAAAELIEKYHTLAENMARVSANADVLNGLNHATGQNMVNAPKAVRNEESEAKGAYFNIASGKRTEESITRVSEKLRKLGVDAAEAAAIQQKAQEMVIAGMDKKATAYIQEQEQLAASNKLQKDALEAESKRFADELNNLKKVKQTYTTINNMVSQIRASQKKQELNTNYALGAKKLAEQMRAAGASEKDIITAVKAELDAVRQKRLEDIAVIEESVQKHILQKNTIEQTKFATEALLNSSKEYISQDWAKMTEQAKLLLNYDSERILTLSKNTEAVQEIRNAYTALQEAVKNGYLTSEEAGNLQISISKTVASGYVDQAAKIAEIINEEQKRGQLNSENGAKIVAQAREEAEARGTVVQWTKAERDQMMLLQQEAISMRAVQKRGNAEEIQLCTEVNEKIRTIIETLQKRGVQIEALIPLIKEMYTAETTGAKETIEALQEKIDKQAKSLGIERESHGVMSVSLTKVGMLAFSVGSLGKMYERLTGQQNNNVDAALEVIQSMGDVAFQIDMVKTAVKDLIPWLKQAYTWFKATAAAKALFQAGPVIAGAAVLGGIGYGLYQKGKKSNPLDSDGDYGPTEDNDGGNDDIVKPAGTNLWDRLTGNAPPSGEQTLRAYKAIMDKEETQATNVSDLAPKYEQPEDEKAIKKAQREAAKAAREAEKERKAAEREAQKQRQYTAKIAEEIRKANDAMRDTVVSQADEIASRGEAWGLDSCAEYVSSVLQNAGIKYPDLNSNRAPTLWARGRNDGIAHYGTEGMQKGDIIFYIMGPDDEGVDPITGMESPGHVGIYDGNGGVIHSSLSAGNYETQVPYHQYGSISMGRGTRVLGYISPYSGVSPDGKSSAELKAQLAELQSQYKILDKKKKATDDVYKMVVSLNEKITDLTPDIPDYEKETAKYQKEIDNLRFKIGKDAGNGADTAIVNKQLDEYIKKIRAKLEEAKREYTISQQEEEQKRLGYSYKMGLITTKQYKEELDKRLEDEREYINSLLSQENLSKDERVKLEQQLTDVIEQQHTRRGTTLQGALLNAGTTLSEYEIDYSSMINSVTGSFQTGFDNMYDGIIDGTKSLTQNMKSAWEDLTNSIINMIWKMAMEMYVVKPLFNWLGGMLNPAGKGISIGGPINFPTYDFKSAGPDVISFGDMSIGTHAKGGIAHGLSLVGEEGPELIDAVTPSRVYTAKQTREALAGGPQNVKVEIVNKSGQDVKASNADVKFDAKGMIISVVIDAVTRNTNGMREIIKGVATT